MADDRAERAAKGMLDPVDTTSGRAVAPSCRRSPEKTAFRAARSGTPDCPAGTPARRRPQLPHLHFVIGKRRKWPNAPAAQRVDLHGRRNRGDSRSCRRHGPHLCGPGCRVRPSAPRPGPNGWRGVQVAGVTAALAGLAIAMIMGRSAVPTAAPGFSGLDLDVYRAGAHALGGGHLLYSDAFDAGRQPHLLFTYPPVGALLMWPMAQIPHLPAVLCWNVLTLAVLAWLIKLTAPALFGPARPRQRVGPGIRLGAAVAAIAWTTPIIDHLGFGQVNVFLLALCAADCLLPRTRGPAAYSSGPRPRSS